MNSKLHRCGYCGQPTDEIGTPLQEKALQKAISIIEQYGDYRTEKTHGDCCAYDQMMEEERRWVQVTRDMASDAGYPEMEGEWIKW